MIENNRVYLSILVLLLFGCTTQKSKIEFIENNKIEAGSSFNTCTLVKSVNDIEITKFHMDGNRIILDEDNTVICPSVDTAKLGNQTINFLINDKNYSYTIDVVDKTAPIIKYKEEKIEVQQGCTREDFFKKLEIRDSYSEFKTDIKGELNFDVPDIYNVEIIVEDSAGNKVKKKISVLVKKREDKRTQTKEYDKKTDATDEKEKQSISSQESDSSYSSEQKEQDNFENESIENKTFLFSEGYDYNTCYEKAVEYAESMINSGKVKGYTCIPIRNERQEYIGYEVVFK